MSKQDFELDLDAVFGERRAEFAPKLKEMLYQLWREGRKRGASQERGAQADHVLGLRSKQKATPSDKFKSPLDRMEELYRTTNELYRTTNEWVTFDSLPTNTSVRDPAPDLPRARSHKERFGRILAGTEEVIKAPKGFPPKEKDYLGRDKPFFGHEFFSAVAGGQTPVIMGGFPTGPKKKKTKIRSR